MVHIMSQRLKELQEVHSYCVAKLRTVNCVSRASRGTEYNEGEGKQRSPPHPRKRWESYLRKWWSEVSVYSGREMLPLQTRNRIGNKRRRWSLRSVIVELSKRRHGRLRKLEVVCANEDEISMQQIDSIGIKDWAHTEFKIASGSRSRLRTAA